jgi:hypothetical protein
VVHALSVSLNKLGDLKYYAQDLEAARTFYSRALELRQNSIDVTVLSSQVRFLFPFEKFMREFCEEFPGTFIIICRLLLLVFRTKKNANQYSLVVGFFKVLDVAVSLAKVADVNRALGKEGSATEGFQEAVKMLETLPKPKLKEQILLEPRVSNSHS